MDLLYCCRCRRARVLVVPGISPVSILEACPMTSLYTFLSVSSDATDSDIFCRLRIEVQPALSGSDAGGQVDGGRCLPDPALVIDHSDRLHDRFPLRQFHGGTGSASAHKPTFAFRTSLSSAPCSMSSFAYCLYRQARPDRTSSRFTSTLCGSLYKPETL
jgi:hypothetical protein